MASIAPWILGPLGVIPFVALTPVSRHDVLRYASLINGRTTAQAQITYGAVILSFLGGIHWGMAAVKHNGTLTPRQIQGRYLWSVIPSLIAWPALLMPEQLAASAVATGLATAAAVDTKYTWMGAFPRWMMPLRYALTATGVVSLLATVVRDRTEDK